MYEKGLGNLVDIVLSVEVEIGWTSIDVKVYTACPSTMDAKTGSLTVLMFIILN